MKMTSLLGSLCIASATLPGLTGEKFPTADTRLEREIFRPDSGWTNLDMNIEKQREVNTIALNLAKAMAVCPTLGEKYVQWGNTLAIDLCGLCRDGLVTDSEIIPFLLTGLKAKRYRNSVIPERSLDSLIYLTHRNSGASPNISEFDLNKPEKLSETVAWWEHWWEMNQSKHPVYDAELDKKLRSEFLRVEDVIEQNVKPLYPELSYFAVSRSIPPVVPLSRGLYVHRYEPYYNSIIPYRGTNTPAWKDLPWLEVACHFEDADMPRKTFGEHEPPERLSSMLMCVYSNHIQGTSICIEVRIASPNKELVNDLREALNAVAQSP